MTTTTPTNTNQPASPPQGAEPSNTNGEPTLDIIIPEEEIEEDKVELDYEKAFTKLPAHIKKAAELFGYKPKAESQTQLEEFVTKLKVDYETELNNSVVPLIVAKMKGKTKVEKPGVVSTSQDRDKDKARITTPYRGY